MVLYMKNYIIRKKNNWTLCSIFRSQGEKKTKGLKFNGSVYYFEPTSLSHLQFSRDPISVHQLKEEKKTNNSCQDNC